jgi:predicted metal-dependent hydrolase
MIDWLLKDRDQPLQVEIGGRLVPLALRRTASARRMTMRLAPDGSEVRITLPRWGRSAEALQFARSKESWLAAQLDALPSDSMIGDGGSLPFLGEMLTLRHDPAQPRRVVLGEGEIRLGGPGESLVPRLSRWMQGEARRIMAEDLSYYCLRASLPVPRLMLSGAQRRWGSCARDGTIRLNWRLVMAPAHVRRSVVAHEVAHLVQFDHSPRFHAVLEQIYEGDIRAANRWLKREGRGLYRPLG